MFNDLFRTRRFLYSIYLFPFQLASSNCAFTLNNILYCHGNATMRVVCYKTKHQIQIITKPLNLSLSLYRLHWLHPPNKVLVFLVQKKKEKTRGLQKEEISQLVVHGYIKNAQIHNIGVDEKRKRQIDRYCEHIRVESLVNWFYFCKKRNSL